MTQFRVSVNVVPRKGLLDPQGKAVADALHSLGFAGVSHVYVGRYLVLHIEAAGEGEARAETAKMCGQLLVNPVTEDFDIASVVAA